MMEKKNKFYEFKNISFNEADLYIYGEIVEDDVDWWSGEKDETLVGLNSFKKELDDIGDVKNLNIYINTPGGDVFVASTMISMLQRKKDKGTTINAYVDGLSASAGSFLMMVADNINLYKNSTVMVHKPMSITWGNANDMQKTIDSLNKIEDSVMMPMYMSKAKCKPEKIKELIDNETWLSAKDMDEYFNVNLLEEDNVAVASISSNLFKNYKNIPDFIKNSLENEKKSQKSNKKEEITPKNEEKEQINEDNASKTKEIEENDTECIENKTKEQEIKTKLQLIKSSLNIKKRKEENRYE